MTLAAYVCLTAGQLFRIGPPQFQEPVNDTPLVMLERVPFAATARVFAAT